ncbi:hypothetical protein H0H87_004753 [Tephrocybe sp. NHM501043]|nr:hypothetical protein H0H87_004753 [Tephrocybe sp. NHM501043]
MHQPQIPYARTTAIVPIDTRSQYTVEDERIPPSVRDTAMTEIMRHCQVLFNFTSRYAQLQQSMPDVCPSPNEVAEMSHRAAEVVRLLEEYRRLNLPESERAKMDVVAMTPPDDHRPPKRPWEDMSQEENSGLGDSTSFAEQQYPTPVDNKMQTTAEQDMEIIRTKRATSTAGGSGPGGQPKSKYRKRSLTLGSAIWSGQRATPPGKCHSCNIRETPEWRRGPDGARTLCNACGLHYAKLQRKRDKAGPNGELPRIDMETLRASARAAEISDKSSRSKNTSARSQQSIEPTSPMDTGKPLPQQHHQGSFQLVPMVQEPAPPLHSDAPRATSQQQATTIGGAPTPPWSASVQPQPPSNIRAYAPEQLQHQSFMRTAHPVTNHTSAR